MKRITLRVSQDWLEHLDALARARNFADRSEAVRVVVREAAMTPEERLTVPDTDELLVLLGQSARDGSVTAMKALLDEHRRAETSEDAGDPFAAFDQPRDDLAERRRRAG